MIRPIAILLVEFLNEVGLRHQGRAPFLPGQALSVNGVDGGWVLARVREIEGEVVP
jgi:hypothetical protein